LIEPPDHQPVDAETLLRAVGFDPTQLTPIECDELAEILTWEQPADSAPANASTR
jgi:hypothetical protein